MCKTRTGTLISAVIISNNVGRHTVLHHMQHRAARARTVQQAGSFTRVTACVTSPFTAKPSSFHVGPIGAPCWILFFLSSVMAVGFLQMISCYIPAAVFNVTAPWPNLPDRIGRPSAMGSSGQATARQRPISPLPLPLSPNQAPRKSAQPVAG